MIYFNKIILYHERYISVTVFAVVVIDEFHHEIFVVVVVVVVVVAFIFDHEIFHSVGP